MSNSNQQPYNRRASSCRAPQIPLQFATLNRFRCNDEAYSYSNVRYSRHPIAATPHCWFCSYAATLPPLLRPLHWPATVARDCRPPARARSLILGQQELGEDKGVEALVEVAEGAARGAAVCVGAAAPQHKVVACG